MEEIHTWLTFPVPFHSAPPFIHYLCGKKRIMLMLVREKKRYLYLLERMLKQKYLSHDPKSESLIVATRAKEAISDIMALVNECGAMYKNYGVSLCEGDKPLYDNDDNFKDDVFSIENRLSEIPYGSSGKHSPFVYNVNTYIEDFEAGYKIEAIKSKKNNGVRFFVNDKQILKQTTWFSSNINEDDYDVSNFARIIDHVFMHSDLFQLLWPNGSIAAEGTTIGRFLLMRLLEDGFIFNSSIKRIIEHGDDNEYIYQFTIKPPVSVFDNTIYHVTSKDDFPPNVTPSVINEEDEDFEVLDIGKY